MEDITDGFLNDLTELVRLKSGLFEEKRSIAAQLGSDSRQMLPRQLRDYYIHAHSRSDIFAKAPVRILRPDELTIEEHDGEKLVVFARSADGYYVYGYSAARDAVMQSHGSVVWSVCHLSDTGSFILYYLSQALTGFFDNIIAVSISFPPAADDYSGYAAECVGMDRFGTLHHSYYSAFRLTSKALLAVFDYDSSRRLIVACDDGKALAVQLGALRHRPIKLDGLPVQDPHRYIKGEPPRSFCDRLVTVYRLLYRDDPPPCAGGDPLETFLGLFAGKKDFLGAELELHPGNAVNELCLIADDPRSALSWTIDRRAGKVYLSSGSSGFHEQDMSVEELLIYLSVVQANARSKACCTAEGSSLARLRPYFFELAVTDRVKCFAAPGRKLLMLCENVSVTITGKTQSAIDKLSADSGVEFSVI